MSGPGPENLPDPGPGNQSPMPRHSDRMNFGSSPEPGAAPSTPSTTDSHYSDPLPRAEAHQNNVPAVGIGHAAEQQTERSRPDELDSELPDRPVVSLPSEEFKSIKDFVTEVTQVARAIDNQFPKVVQQAKEVLEMVKGNIQSKSLRQVEATELEAFAHRIVLGTIQITSNDQLARVVQAILSDDSAMETLQQLVELAQISSQLTDVANQVTGKIARPGDPDRKWVSPLMLGAAFVLAAMTAGAVVPLLAGAVVQTILANEVAIAAVVVGAAALVNINRD